MPGRRLEGGLPTIEAQPVYGALSYRRYVARIEAGEAANRPEIYMQTFALEWAFMAALALAWFTLGRPASDLGFVAPAGAGFWDGALFLALFTVYLLFAWQKAKKTSDEDKAKQLGSLGMLVHFLPQSRADLPSYWLPILGHAVLDIVQGLSIVETFRRDGASAKPLPA